MTKSKQKTTADQPITMKGNKMNALLSLRITVDHEDLSTPLYTHIKLYREAEGLIWRMGGEMGNECETLPRPSSVKRAKADARLVYRVGGPFKPVAAWL